MVSNKKSGNSFEKELCDKLFGYGFWVHRFAQNQIGQPVDIIAVRNNMPYLIDCKVCANDRFALSRVEENQLWAMSQWRGCRNDNCHFALKDHDGIFMMHYSMICALMQSKKSLSREDISRYGTEFMEWMSKCR